MSAVGSYYDAEATSMGGYGNLKLNQSIRNEFIRKVYTIVTVQLLITFACGLPAILAPPITFFLQAAAIPIVICGSIIQLVVALYLICKRDAKENYPTNYILLFTHTLAVSACVSVSIAFSHGQHVLMAVATLIVVVGSVTLFATQTKYDATGWGSYMLVVLISFCCFGIFCIFFRSNILGILYSTFGAIIFSIYLLIDTQLLLGRGKVKAEEDDYIIVALMLYTDIIQIFLYLLDLFRRTT